MFEKLTEKELRENLLTADYKGSKFKEGCLEELIRRRLKREEVPNPFTYREKVITYTIWQRFWFAMASRYPLPYYDILYQGEVFQTYTYVGLNFIKNLTFSLNRAFTLGNGSI